MSQNAAESEAIHPDRVVEVSKGGGTPEERKKARTARLSGGMAGEEGRPSP
jgi:hypothetical protein